MVDKVIMAVLTLIVIMFLFNVGMGIGHSRQLEKNTLILEELRMYYHNEGL